MSLAPRWRKVVRDLLERPGRSILAVLALAAGVFQITAMLYKYALLQPVLTSMYGETRPASATLVLDHLTDALVDSVRAIPGVADAEAHPVIIARASTGPDEWVPVVLYVTRDFDHQRIDTFKPQRGAWPPGANDVLLERSALQVAGVEVGDSLLLRLAGGDETLRVAGTVHAAGMAPAWMEHMVPGFVGWDSRARLAGEESAQLRIVVADHPLDEGYIREVADSVKVMLERGGHRVSRVTVPPPGRHPHADQMEAFLFLLLAFGVLSFTLSVVLVASMIHSLMSEQVRQMGMMQAIGATRRQIAGIYLGQVAVLAAASLAVGIPLGLVVGRAYAGFAAGILNADITHRPFPWWLIAAECVAGILVPLLVAMGPVRRAASIGVREALSDDLGSRPFGSRRAERWSTRQRWLPRPLAVSLRATLARRTRLILTVVSLAMGGAVFMSALNVSGAWTRAVDKDFAARRYDLTLSLARPFGVDTLDAVLAAVPEVADVEYWPGASPYLIGPAGVPGNTVALVAPDPGSALLALPVLEGRWLRAGDVDGAVVNQAVMRLNPSLHVGGYLQVRMEGRTTSIPILGIVKELTPMPVIYATRRAVLAASGRGPDRARTVRIVTRDHDDAAQRAAARSLESAFEARGIEVSGLQRMLDARKGILDHLVIIMAILTMASLVVVAVGALALTSSLMLSVIQRTREFGILGAIGATAATIARHVWFEALALGLLSWAAACILSAPISYALEAACGRIFFKVPLDFYLSPLAAAAWLGLVLLLATLSSVQPARRATRLTIREALSHA